MKKLFIIFLFIIIFTTAISTDWEYFYCANKTEITDFISNNNGVLLSVDEYNILVDVNGNVHELLINRDNQLVLYDTEKLVVSKVNAKPNEDQLQVQTYGELRGIIIVLATAVPLMLVLVVAVSIEV